MVLVRFNQPHDLYNGGETAGFDDAKAKQLVVAGVAEYHNAAQADAGDVIAEAVAEEPAAEVAEISDTAADAVEEVSDAPAPKKKGK